MDIKLYRNGHLSTPEPVRKHENDVGADVYAVTDAVIPAHGSLRYNLGFGIELPVGFVGLIYPRSGMTAKGIGMEMPPIDPGYTGDIHAILINHTDTDYQIKTGDRIGQLLVQSVITPNFVFMTDEEEAAAKQKIEAAGARGNNGFGSTGK